MKYKFTAVIGMLLMLSLTGCVTGATSAPSSSEQEALSVKEVQANGTTLSYVSEGPELQGDAAIVGYGRTASDLNYASIGVWVEKSQFDKFVGLLNDSPGAVAARYPRAVTLDQIAVTRSLVSQLNIINNTSFDAVLANFTEKLNDGRTPEEVLVFILPVPSCKNGLESMKSFQPESITVSTINWCEATPATPPK